MMVLGGGELPFWVFVLFCFVFFEGFLRGGNLRQKAPQKQRYRGRQAQSCGAFSVLVGWTVGADRQEAQDSGPQSALNSHVPPCVPANAGAAGCQQVTSKTRNKTQRITGFHLSGFSEPFICLLAA